MNGQLKWLDSAAIQAKEQARRSSAFPVFADACLKDSAAYHKMAERIRAIWSPKPPSAEAKPDPIQAVYERFKHLDRLLCEATDEDNLWLKTAAGLWLAVKAKVEGQPAGQTEQAKE